MDSSPTRILLAEDEVAIARPIVADLVEAGYEVRWAETTREMREAVAEQTPDILILDNTLDVDGLEYLQSIRFAADHPRGGVIVISDSVAARERGLQLGAAAALPKPVVTEQLLQTLSELLAYT